MRVLVVNTGSSSLKLAVVSEARRVEARRTVDPWGGDLPPGALEELVAGGGPVDAVGHRVVHGGRHLRSATPVDAAVVEAVEALVTYAPLHQARALAAIRAVGRALPDIPAVACFDTAFHATIPDAAATYAVPGSWRERFGLRRHGFHGLSHAWVAHRVPEMLGRPASELRIVSCHVGGGTSLCAVDAGRSVDTTMGFTPLEGAVMATRSGTVDPGMVLWLVRHGGLDVDEVQHGLERAGGLAALSGVGGDLRDVLAAATGGDARAAAALDVWAHRMRGLVAAMAAAMGGADVLAFTGGAGEHQPELRARVVDGLGFLGASLDPARNAAVGDAVVSPPGSACTVVSVATGEHLQIAAEVERVLASGTGGTRRRPGSPAAR